MPNPMPTPSPTEPKPEPEQATFSFQENEKRPSLADKIFSDKKRGHRDSDTEVCDELLAYHTPTSE